MRSLIRALALLFISGLFLAGCAGATSPAGGTGSAADQLSSAAKEIDKAIDALQAGDSAKAKKEYQEFDEDWDKFEDKVKAKSADSYKKIEAAMDDVKDALVTPATVDKDKAVAALRKLRQTIDAALPALR